MSNLCPKHRAEHDSWLDYKAPVPAGPIAQSGPASVQRSISIRTARTKEWARTIRIQHALIAESCKDGLGCSDDPKEAFAS